MQLFWLAGNNDWLWVWISVSAVLESLLSASTTFNFVCTLPSCSGDGPCAEAFSAAVPRVEGQASQCASFPQRWRGVFFSFMVLLCAWADPPDKLL